MLRRIAGDWASEFESLREWLTTLPSSADEPRMFLAPAPLYGPSADVDARRARALLEMGRNEDAYRAFVNVIDAGVPWWLLQGRDLAAGRLALLLGHEDIAIRHLTASLRIPLNGEADADLLIETLIELSRIDSAHVPWAPTRAQWAELALDVADRVSPSLQGHWIADDIEEELRATAGARAMTEAS